jgi:hypothetical protein
MSRQNDAITQQVALEIFQEYIEQKKPTATIYRITETLPAGCRAYGPPQEDCWYIFYALNRPIGMICSSDLIAVSKKTGKVIYEGSANDEG